MNRELVFTPIARQSYEELSNDPAKEGTFKQVRKTLALIETNLRHRSLETHEYQSFKGLHGEKVFEA